MNMYMPTTNVLQILQKIVLTVQQHNYIKCFCNSFTIFRFSIYLGIVIESSILGNNETINGEDLKKCRKVDDPMYPITKIIENLNLFRCNNFCTT